MSQRFLALLIVALAMGGIPVPLPAQQTGVPANSFRPRAVPLITHSPYFSIWSMSDKLTDDWPRHWTGAVNALAGMIRIDGATFRVMGKSPGKVAPMNQTSLHVHATRTIYEFEQNGVHLEMTFMTPLIPHDLDLLSRPVTYLTWNVRSIDGKQHSVELYFDNSAELVVNTSEQHAIWSRFQIDGMTVLSMGSQEQRVLGKSGDDLRIDWGFFSLGIPNGVSCRSVITGHSRARSSFAETGKLPASDDMRMPRAANDDWIVSAVSFDLGSVGENIVSRRLLLAYDERYPIEYMDRKLRPYWKRKGMDIAGLLTLAEREYASIESKCRKFDDELAADLLRIGGEKYRAISTLAYRQCLAAHGLAVDINGTPLLFPKENFSNGCISTVDVLYPSSPFFLLFNPALMRAALRPVLEYAASDRWKFPFAPHDLGTYPLANGQVYGGGEKGEENQMPVEESGNMIIMMAALAKIEGNADFAKQYWKLLRQWAAYLRDKGLDPENQLCTDDFAGHLAHNANLSIKAIVALRAYATLCTMTGNRDEAKQYERLAKEFSAKWETMADDGDHYRLAFDKEGTWSQKYNLVWDKLLGYGLFPKEVAQREISYYLTKLNKYGLPLDNRESYTKLDWIVWTATLAGTSADFERIVAPAYEFLNDSPSRVPMSDWYSTVDAKQVGFQARSVVGGVFIKMLSDESMWKRWAQKGQ